jgi:hypothetical protein
LNFILNNCRQNILDKKNNLCRQQLFQLSLEFSLKKKYDRGAYQFLFR